MKPKLLYILSFSLAFLLSQVAYSQEIRELVSGGISAGGGQEGTLPYGSVLIVNRSSGRIKFYLRSSNGNNQRAFLFEIDSGDDRLYACYGPCINGNIDFGWPGAIWERLMRPGETWKYCGYNSQYCGGKQWKQE